MQKAFAIFSTTLVFCSWALCATPAAAEAVVGKPAPDFEAKDDSGKTVKLSDFKGKIVVLEWTSNECPVVKKHYDSGNMQRLQKLATAEGIIWLSVDSSGMKRRGYMDGPAAKAWVAGRRASPTDFLIDASGAVGHLYGAKTTPHMFIIDKNGTVAYAGAIDSIPSANPKDIDKAINFVQSALNELKAGKPIKIAETKSYGCGIKYGE